MDGAVSEQQSANTLFLMSFAESRKLMADSAHPKTLVFGCALGRHMLGGFSIGNPLEIGLSLQKGIYDPF